MRKKLPVFLWIFYAIIVLYTLFAVLHINMLANFIPSLVFEGIGLLTLAYLIFHNVFSGSVKIGFLVPLIMVTVVYTMILDCIHIALAATMNSTLFVLINLVLLFIYCLLSIPMYLIGKR